MKLTPFVVTTPANLSHISTPTQIVSGVTPTLQITPNQISSNTITPTILSSPPPNVIPSLTIENANARLIDLLSNNGGCRLPCLWGITPGSTTNQEARIILAPLSSLSDFNVFDSDSGTIDISYGLKDNQFLSITVIYLANQGNVFRVSFQARALKNMVDEIGVESVFDSTGYGELLDFYMLQQVLASYGRPSSVLLHTWGKRPSQTLGQGHFRLILLYPEQGIVVEYTTEMRVVGNNVEGCLANTHVEMELFPPGNIETFNAELGPTGWPDRMADYKSIEEVTSLSIDDFYQIYRQPTEKCLVTPARLWPLPEEQK